MKAGSGGGVGRGDRERDEGREAGARGRAARPKTSTRARALFEFVVHTVNAMSGAMQFSGGGHLSCRARSRADRIKLSPNFPRARRGREGGRRK